jgi:cell division protein FtsN
MKPADLPRAGHRNEATMPTNEEGEFELVLGNKQLLSVFFIVVVLLGVFFTMGYIVGRNMSPAGGPQMAGNTESNPLVVEPAGPGAPPPPAPAPSEKPSPLPPTSTTPTSTAPPTTTTAPPKPEPAKPEPAKPEPAKPAPPKPEPAKTVPPKPAPPKAEPPKTTPPKPAATKPAPAPTSGGTYLQVAATRKPDADMLVDVISKKGFRVTVAPVPDSELYRVLVGPAAGPDELNKLKSDLAAIGFKGFPRKM